MPTNVKEIVKKWLVAEAFDGLYSEGGECACLLPDIAPCGGEGFDTCCAGRLAKCIPEECPDGGCEFHIAEEGHKDQMTSTERHLFFEARRRSKLDNTPIV